MCWTLPLGLATGGFLSGGANQSSITARRETAPSRHQVRFVSFVSFASHLFQRHRAHGALPHQGQ